MRTLRSNVIRICCLAALATATNAQSVKVNWQNNAPFADYKTYAWQFSSKEKNSFYKQFVSEYFNQEMGAKGLQQTSGSQKPDLLVTYHFTTQEMIDATTTTDGFDWSPGFGRWGYWGGWGGWGDVEGMSSTQEHPRTMGILTIDLIDAKKRQLVWRGQATEDSVSSSQKGDEQQVRKSISKMFAHYPPKQS